MSTYPHGPTYCTGCSSCQPDRFPGFGVASFPTDGRAVAAIILPTDGGPARILIPAEAPAATFTVAAA